jgi:hypothetical protein
VLRNTHYQASSIHSRKRLSSFIRHQNDKSPRTSPPPPPPQSPLPPVEQVEKRSGRTEKENKLLSDLWLMSAATFRRLGKIEQAKAAIQEAEVRDEGNPGVWVQVSVLAVVVLLMAELSPARFVLHCFGSQASCDRHISKGSLHIPRRRLCLCPTLSSVSYPTFDFWI